MKKTVIGDFFIIPNDKVDQFQPFNKPFFDQFEGVNEQGPFVQIWAANDECDNFQANWKDYLPLIGIDTPDSEGSVKDAKGQTHHFGKFTFPLYLPLYMLEGIKDGDQLTLTWKNQNGVSKYDEVEFILTASQLKYRYNHLGNFEETLKRLG